MTAASWEDRVFGKLRALREQAQADGEWFHQMCMYMDRWEPGTREALERNDQEGVATKFYKEQPVYTVRVKEGHTIVHPTGGAVERFADNEQALERMADLLARAIHDAKWGKEQVAA